MCFLPPAVLETAAQTVAKTTGHHAPDDADRRDRRASERKCYRYFMYLYCISSTVLKQFSTTVYYSSTQLQDCATSTAAPTELYEL